MDPEKLKTQDPIVKLKTSLIELKGEPHLGYLLSGIALPDNQKVLEHLLKMAQEADKTKHTDPVWLKAQAKALVTQMDKGVEETTAIEPTIDSIINHILKQTPEGQRKTERERLRRELMSWKYGDVKLQVKELIRRSSGWVFEVGDEQDWNDLVEAIEKLPGSSVDIETRITQYRLVYDALNNLHRSAVFPSQDKLEQLKQQLADIQGRFVPEVRGDAEFITARYIPRINQAIQSQFAQAREIRRDREFYGLNDEEIELIKQGPEGWEVFFEDLMFFATANPRARFHWTLQADIKLETLKGIVEKYYKGKGDEQRGKEVSNNYGARKAQRDEIHERKKTLMFEAFDMKTIQTTLAFQSAHTFDVLTKGEGIVEVDAGRDYVSLANQFYETALTGIINERYMCYQELVEKRDNGLALTLEEESLLEQGVYLQDKDLNLNIALFQEYEDRMAKGDIWAKYVRKQAGFDDREKAILDELKRQQREMGNLTDEQMAVHLDLTEAEKKMLAGKGLYSPVEERVYKAVKIYAEQKLKQQFTKPEELKQAIQQEEYKIRRALFFASAHHALSLRMSTINAKMGIVPISKSTEELLRSWGSTEHVLRVFNWNKMMFYRFFYFDDPVKRAEILTLYRDYFDDLQRQLRIDQEPAWRNEWVDLRKKVTEVIHSGDPKRADLDTYIPKMEEFFKDKTGIGYNELIAGGFLIRIGGIYDGTDWRAKLALMEPFREHMERLNRVNGGKKSWKEFVLGLQYQMASDAIANEVDNFTFIEPGIKDMDFLSHLKVVRDMPKAAEVKGDVVKLINAIEKYQQSHNPEDAKKVKKLWDDVNEHRFDTRGANLRIKDQVVLERKRAILKLMATRTPTVIAELFPEKVRTILTEQYGQAAYEKNWSKIYQALMLSQGQITTDLVTGGEIEKYFTGDVLRQNYLGLNPQASRNEIDGAIATINKLRKIVNDMDLDPEKKKKLDVFLRHPFSMIVSMVDIPYQLTDFQKIGGAGAIYRRLGEVSAAAGGYEALSQLLEMPPDLKTIVEATRDYTFAIHGYDGAGDDVNNPCGGGSLPRARRLAAMTLEITKSGQLTRLFPGLEPLLVRLADPANEWGKGIEEIAQNFVSVIVKHRGARGMNWEGPDINEYLQMLRTAGVFIGNHEIMKQLLQKYGATNYENMMFQIRKLIVPVLMWAVLTAMAGELQKKSDEGEEH